MGKHKNRSQGERFVHFMEAHEDLASGSLGGDRVLKEELWKQLGDELNACGPPIKSVQEWKKTWLDWKANIRKKINHNMHQLEKTGGESYDLVTISNAEETIARISGLNQSGQQIKATCKEELNSSSGIFETLPSKSDPLDSEEDGKPSFWFTAEPTEVSSSTLVSESQSSRPKKRRRYQSSDASEAWDVETENFKNISDKLSKLCEHQKNISNKLENMACKKTDVQTENFKYMGDKLLKICEHQKQIKIKLEEMTCIKRDQFNELKRHHLVMEKCAAERNEHNRKLLKLETLKWKMLEMDKSNK